MAITIKKKKRSKILIIKEKAWNAFSKWIRARDKKCVTCGSYKALQAGHFWHNCLDFDEININAQCAGCNHYMSGNLAKYASYLINKYGVEEYAELEARHYLALKGERKSIEDYQNIINKYTIKTVDNSSCVLE